jgi:hypothetical protein
VIDTESLQGIACLSHPVRTTDMIKYPAHDKAFGKLKLSLAEMLPVERAMVRNIRRYQDAGENMLK